MKEIRFEDPIIFMPGHIQKTSGISSTARTILDVILLLMDYDNFIVFEKDTIDKMEIMLKQFCQKEYTDNTIRNSINELYNFNLLLRFKNNHYYANPEYFIKYSFDQYRKSLINRLYSNGLYISKNKTTE